MKQKAHHSLVHLIREYRLEMRCLYVSHALECHALKRVIITAGISVISAKARAIIVMVVDLYHVHATIIAWRRYVRVSLGLGVRVKSGLWTTLWTGFLH